MSPVYSPSGGTLQRTEPAQPNEPGQPNEPVRFALPKGRMQEEVRSLLAEAGVRLRAGARGYRPAISMSGFETKLLKPQNVVKMLHGGSRDVGFAGADWVAELGAELVELVDTGLDPVRVVAAAPAERASEGLAGRRGLVVASEYESLTRAWIARGGLDARFVRSYGATEAFPPEDADVIIDNTATGATLAANGLVIVDELMRSSTRLYANPRALDDPLRRGPIESLALVVGSVLAARARVMVEVNVSSERLEALVEVLPCMDRPTVARLHGEAGYGVKAAVPRELLPGLVPELKACGGTDIVVSAVAQIVP